MRTLNNLSFLAVCLFLVVTPSRGQSYDEALVKMQARSRALRAYSCTFVSYACAAEKKQDVTYNYYFKKPGSVRMEAVTGKYEGTVLLYTGGEVRVKLGHGILSWFTFSYEPSHRYVCDARGNGIHQSSWLYFIDEHLRMRPSTRARYAGSEVIGGTKVLRYDLSSIDPAKTRSIASEQIWIDARDFVLVQYKQFDASGTLVQSGRYQDIVIDPDLGDTLFTELSK